MDSSVPTMNEAMNEMIHEHYWSCKCSASMVRNTDGLLLSSRIPKDLYQETAKVSYKHLKSEAVNRYTDSTLINSDSRMEDPSNCTEH